MHSIDWKQGVLLIGCNAVHAAADTCADFSMLWDSCSLNDCDFELQSGTDSSPLDKA